MADLTEKQEYALDTLAHDTLEHLREIDNQVWAHLNAIPLQEPAPEYPVGEKGGERG